jgi:hypothetical protein
MALKLGPQVADNRLIPELSAHIDVSHGARPAGRLHICARCDSELVQPSDWEEAGGDRWQLRLACPNCGWSRRGTFSSVQLTALEDHLDGGFDVLLRDLKRLTAANMTEEIERFAVALEIELILPEDF